MAGVLVVIALQIRYHLVRRKLAKTEAARRLLEQQLAMDKQNAIAAGLAGNADKIVQRIENRKQQLDAVYEKLGITNTELLIVATDLDNARARARR